MPPGTGISPEFLYRGQNDGVELRNLRADQVVFNHPLPLLFCHRAHFVEVLTSVAEGGAPRRRSIGSQQPRDPILDSYRGTG